MTACQSQSSKIATARLSGNSSNEFERKVIDSRRHGEGHEDDRERYGWGVFKTPTTLEKETRAIEGDGCMWWAEQVALNS